MYSVKNLTRQLGIHSTYKGYHYLVETLDMALENEELMILFSKNIYPQVAKKFNTSVSRVDRDIRTVVEHCWNSPCQEKLQSISPYHLVKQPTVGEFIDILYWHIKCMDE